MGFLLYWRADRDIDDFAAIHLNVGNVLDKYELYCTEGSTWSK